jgi:N-acyl-D-amino-acid deacylase
MIDYLIKNAILIDGSGAPGFPGDLAIRGAHIHQMGRIEDREARVTIDGAGKVLAPGFIDMHSHSDLLLANGCPVAHKIAQGVTTEVIGQDGISAAPLTPESMSYMADIIEPLSGRLNREWSAWDMRGFLGTLAHTGIQTNTVTLTGHCNLRLAVMGYTMAAASAGELRRMQELLAQSLSQGSHGLSLGLIYPPSSYSNTPELIALGETVSRFDRILVAHIRDEQDGQMEALEEMITIGRVSGCRVHISHLKCMGRRNWGKMPRVLERLDRALEEGIRVSFDQYPYDASSTTLALLLPGWAMEGGWEGFRQRVEDPAVRSRVMAGIRQSIDNRGGPTSIRIASVPTGAGSGLAGKEIGAIAAAWRVPPEDAVYRILYEARLGAIAIYHAMSSQDVELAMRHRLHSVGSDGVLGDHPHPRAYGTFPRIIGRFQAEKGLFPLGEAIRKMTSWPAAIMQLPKRGVLAEGHFADLVLFDPVRFIDRADYDLPTQTPDGLDWVFINGAPALKKGQPLDSVFSGRVLVSGA